MSKKFALFLYSNGNILGSSLALLGLVLFFTGLIKSFWLLIVIGLYGIGYLIAPENRTLNFSIEQDLSQEELKKALKQLSKKIEKRVSVPVFTKANSIIETISELLPQLNKLKNSQYQLHTVKQTVTDYLPEMFNSYLQLPAAYARFHPVKDNKTPRELLLEQLDILDQEMKQVLIDVNKHDTEALISHGNFIKSKFSKGDDWLN